MVKTSYAEWHPMAWAELRYSKNQVNLAGDALISLPPDELESIPDRDRALDIINNWRSCHSYPLNSIQMTLRRRSRAVDGNAIIVQRLKRLVSIDLKLRRFGDWLKLSKMQDIGGCRAVVRTVHMVERLDGLYKNGRSISEFRRRYDYITEPKSDGYRSVHYVYKYISSSPHYEIYNGLQIEVQLRSKAQHIWATANETVSTFTYQRLKAGVGESEWLRFFALMANAIAIAEKRILVPGTPEEKKELSAEIQYYADLLDVEPMLSGWQVAMKHLAEQATGAQVFLLVLDPDARVLTVEPFAGNDVALASDRYLGVEREIRKNPRMDAVLVRGDSISALRRAYPNYYADIGLFLRILARVLQGTLW